MADLEQQIPVTALPIAHQGDLAGAFDDISKDLYRPEKQRSIFLPAAQRPDESTGSLHQHDRPAFTLFHRHILVHLGI
jgi:hypothetical protein